MTTCFFSAQEEVFAVRYININTYRKQKIREKALCTSSNSVDFACYINYWHPRERNKKTRLLVAP